MRVVIATRIFAPEPAAAALRLAALADALIMRGHEVEVLTSKVPGRFQEEPRAGIRVRRWPVLRDRSGAVRGYIPYLSFDIPLLFRLLVARRPDVVVVEPPPTTGAVVRIVSRARRIPYVYYAGDILGDAAGAAASATVVNVVRWLESQAWRGADRVITVSTAVSTRIAELEPRARVITVGAGIDVSRFRPVGPVAEIGGRYLVYTGTASEVHGAAIFARAFARIRERHPEAALVYIGGGAEWDEISGIAAQAEGAIRLLPHMQPEEVAKWLRGAAAALASVRPDSGYDVAFPTKAYAALACGTPVLYAGEGGARGLLAANPGIGWGVPFDDAAVAEALSRALETPRTRPRSEIAAWAADAVNSEGPARRAAEQVVEAASAEAY